MTDLQNLDHAPDCSYVSARTLAAWLGVSQVTVWRWVKSGRLPAPKKTWCEHDAILGFGSTQRARCDRGLIGSRMSKRILTTGVVKPRSRRTNAEIIQLEQQIYDVLEEDHPQSVRHVFYRMTDPRLPVFVEKSDHGYKQIQLRMTEMRRPEPCRMAGLPMRRGAATS